MWRWHDRHIVFIPNEEISFLDYDVLNQAADFIMNSVSEITVAYSCVWCGPLCPNRTWIHFNGIFAGLKSHWDPLCPINEFFYVVNDKYKGVPATVYEELF